jgi:cysteinyl-tRNA synthetase
MAVAFKEQAGGLLGDPLPPAPQELLILLLRARDEARRQKNYQVADALREAFRKIGIILEDTPRGVRWRLV